MIRVASVRSRVRVLGSSPHGRMLISGESRQLLGRPPGASDSHCCRSATASAPRSGRGTLGRYLGLARCGQLRNDPGPPRQWHCPGGTQYPFRLSRVGPRPLDHQRLLQQRPRTSYDLARHPCRCWGSSLQYASGLVPRVSRRTTGLPKRRLVRRHDCQRQFRHRLGGDPLDSHPYRWIGSPRRAGRR